MTDASLDGNAAAGALSELFATDLTAAVTTCASCGAVGPIAGLRAYVRAPGVVLRCQACEAVQVRLVRGPGRVWVDLRGVRVLEIGIGGDGS